MTKTWGMTLWYDHEIGGYTAHPSEAVRPTMIESYLIKKELEDATKAQNEAAHESVKARPWWHLSLGQLFR